MNRVARHQARLVRVDPAAPAAIGRGEEPVAAGALGRRAGVGGVAEGRQARAHLCVCVCVCVCVCARE